MKKLLLGLVLSCGVSAFAGEWYVDAANYGKGGDGSEANPFGSLQEANDSASVVADDTIYVAEGDYNQGSSDFETYSYSSQTSYSHVRLKATKALKYVATGDRDKTIIWGKFGEDSGSFYYHRDGIGCVGVAKTASGISFRGITFKDGYHHQSARSGMASGGIMSALNSGAEFTAIDCLFDACIGRYGGGMGQGGIAIRCTFTHCGGNYCGSAAYGLKAYNCLFVRNGRTADELECASGNYASVVYNCELVNCLIYACGYHNGIRNNGNLLGNYYNVAVCDSDDDAAYTVTNGKFRNCATREAMGSAVDTDETVRQLFAGTTEEYVLATNLCVNACIGDYAPVAGGFLDGTGNAEYRDLSWIPAAERNFYFDGTAMPTTAATPIGLLLPSKTVTSGPLVFGDQKLTVNGQTLAKTSRQKIIYQGSWPEQVAIGIAPGQTKVTGCDSYGRPRFAGKDKIWQLLPPKHNTDGNLYAPSTITALEYEYEYWVNKSYQGADVDGSEEKPFKTLQAALDVLVNYKETLIHVAKGTYGDDQGYTEAAKAGGVNTRLVLPAYKYAVILATDGPSETIIEGAAATTGSTGNGTDAVRCLYCGSGADVAFCGFTFKNGYVYGDDDTENSTYCGGAIYCVNSSPMFYDCVITGSAGRHVVWNGRYFRCQLKLNYNRLRGVVGGSNGNCILSSTLWANNINKSGSYDAMFNYVYTLNCSMAETNAPNGNIWNINCRCLNAAVYATGKQDAMNTDGEMIGCVGASSGGNAMTAYDSTDNLKKNPFFINMRDGDYRLSSTSPALKAGLVKAGSKFTYDVLLSYLRGDINNKRLVQTDGTINAGCYADAGVVQPTQLFVSPTGNDANDGLSEAKPKQSLQAACDSVKTAATGYPEDIYEVVALPGTYKIGEKCHTGSVFSGTPTQKSRVVIPPGITLKSKTGPEDTIIEGELDTSDDADTYGCGPNALRCAFIDNNAVLSGFTLTKGRTRNTSISGYVDDSLGGGVYGRSVKGAVCTNCIVCGNISRNGGGGSHVTFKNCVISNNCATSYGNFFRTGRAYDCYVVDNYGSAVLTDLTEGLVGCTFGENYSAIDRSEAQPIPFSNSGSAAIVNCLFLGSDYRDPKLSSGTGSSITNCVYPSGAKWTTAEGVPVVGFIHDKTAAEIQAKYDADGRPTSKDAVGVDKGLNGVSTSDVDRDGNRRVINGTVDIGIYEYDWIKDYAKALGRRVEVTAYSEGVVETDAEKVTLADGATLTATIAKGNTSASSKDYRIEALVPAGGSLTVTLNDAVLGTLTADGSLNFTNALATNDLKFEYTGTDACTVTSIAGNQPLCIILQ